jgi:O-antigen/teichoic acid export membrane protein
MSTMRKIAHNTLVQIIGKISSTILGLIALGMMTRYLGQEQFGWYITVISFLGFVGILIDFGLVPVTAQMMSEPKFDKKELFKNLLAFRFVSALILLGLTPLTALLFPYTKEVKIAISFTTISFLAIAMNQVLIGFYQTRLKMHFQAIGENIGRIVLVVGLILLIKNQASFLQIMGVVVASSVAYTVFIWARANRESPAGFAYNPRIWKAIVTKMWPIAIAIIFNVVYLKGDVILLSVFRAQTEVGIYGAAYRVIEILTQLAMMLMGVMLPLLTYSWTRNKKKDFKKYYQQSFDFMMMLAVPMMVGVIVLAEGIMTLVAGHEFATSEQALQILAIAVFGLYLGAVFGHTAVALNKQKKVLWIYITTAIITLIGYLIFIPQYGMFGAAWMTVFSELYAGTLLFFSVKHYSQEKLQIQTFAKIIFASLVMASVLSLLQNLHVLVLVALGGTIYALLLLAFGAISKSTLKEIVSLKK